MVLAVHRPRQLFLRDRHSRARLRRADFIFRSCEIPTLFSRVARLVLFADADLDKVNAPNDAGKIFCTLPRADRLQLFFKLQSRTGKFNCVVAAGFVAEIIFAVAIELRCLALRFHIFIGRIFRRTFAKIFSVAERAKKNYRHFVCDDANFFLGIFLLADLREKL